MEPPQPARFSLARIACQIEIGAGDCHRLNDMRQPKILPLHPWAADVAELASRQCSYQLEGGMDKTSNWPR